MHVATSHEPLDAPDAGDPVSAPGWLAVSRGVAFFVGVFALLNLLGELGQAGPEANLWWLDLPRCPAPLGRSLLSVVALLFIAFAVRPKMPVPLRGAAISVVVLLLAVALWNTLAFYSQLRAGSLRAEPALPLSLHLASCLIVILAGLRTPAGTNRLERRHMWLFTATLLVCAITLPLAQMYCFGRTDHRRPADLLVVFGSGSEPEAIRRLARQCGVPEDRILAETDEPDPERLVRKLLDQYGTESAVLIVGDFHVLPRMKLCCRRAGIVAHTVPVEARNAPPGRVLLPEVAALWWYYLRPFAG